MDKKFIVETSARHIHLSKEDLETLFGDGYQLTNKKNLSQPGQFACEEKVTVVGTKGEQKMSVLTNMTQWTYAGAAFLQKPNWQPDTRLWVSITTTQRR